jgi:hypothetical protein
MEDTQNNNQALPTTTIPATNYGGEISSNIVIEKKKRGRKKNSVISAPTIVSSDLSSAENIIVPEKKTRKKRTVKPKVAPESVATDGASTVAVVTGDDSTIAPIKKRKRRVCKNQDSKTNADAAASASGNMDLGGNNAENGEADAENADKPPPEEKVAKKRGRKPKGGKIITQHVNENNNTNDMPNIILHLKCSLSSITNNDSSSLDDASNNNSNVESYNSSHITGSEINTGTNSAVHNTETCRKPLPISSVDDSKNNSILSNYGDSSMFKVYDPNISLTHGNCNAVGEFPFSEKSIRQPEDSRFSANMSNSNNLNNSNMFNVTYSPDISLYNSNNSGNNSGNNHINNHSNNNGNNHSNEYMMSRGNNSNNVCIGKDRDHDIDNDNDTDASNLNEREIWRKINQLKLSFHKSDICQNLGGTQRSACFWCTCEFDSPAIYIPKSCSKEGYQVYGCFCSPECAAAFLMNENIDTSTRFERYHLLNSVYGKIYKYEKSIKIAPNPYYLLNKYYGNLTIQEYRKLFHSDQMIYVVNKPLTHILPELYEDNNDFLLNTKIIPTHSVNIKKNKPLKSNILNNAFGIN